MSRTGYPQLPAGALITAVLVLIPLPLHWRTRNVATIAIITWLFAVDIVSAVNAIIWTRNLSQSTAVWCDICTSILSVDLKSHIWMLATKITIGASVAIPAATMCVCKHLAVLSSCCKVQSDHYLDRRRQIIFESLMCFGVPVIIMGLRAFYFITNIRDTQYQFFCRLDRSGSPF